MDVSITDKYVQYMLTRCTQLEFFEVSYYRMITGLWMPHPLNQLKHLVVDKCPLHRVIEVNCSPTILEYTGPCPHLYLVQLPGWKIYVLSSCPVMLFLTTWSLDSLVLCQVSRLWPYIVHNGRLVICALWFYCCLIIFMAKLNLISLLFVCYVLQRII